MPRDPEPIFVQKFVAELTAYECGSKLGYAHQAQLAEVLWRISNIARTIDWPKKCRLVGECLDPDQCDRVRETLETLCERLQEAASEQRAADGMSPEQKDQLWERRIEALKAQHQ